MGPGKVKNALKKQWRTKHWRQRVGAHIVVGVEFPPLADLRAAFVKKHGPQDWRAADVHVWEGSDEVPF
jgi:hypothetical protein